MNTHTNHRPSPLRRGFGAQLLRVVACTASALAIVGFVAADVVAAEPSSSAEPSALVERMIFAADDLPDLEDEGPALFAAAINLPDGAAPASSSPPPPPPPLVKRRPKKLRFGRFEGY